MTEAQWQLPPQLNQETTEDFENYVNNANSSEQAALERTKSAYKPLHQRFVKKGVRFTTQYSHIYLNRLLATRPLILAEHERTWPKDKPRPRIVQKVIDIAAGAEVFVLGTLFKEQALKPNALDEFSNEFDGGKFEVKDLDNYCTDEDALVLEDESGRMVLTGFEDESLIHQLVTGIVCGVKGKLLQTGEFQVSGLEDFCFAAESIPKTIKNKAMDTTENGSARYVLLVSGLNTGGKQDPIRVQLLVDYVVGFLAGQADRKLQQDIVRVILAGNSLRKETIEDPSEPIGKQKQESMSKALKLFDQTLCTLASSVNVDVLPGHDDPVTHTLPQQPLHACLLPNASRYSTFKSVTNPYECQIEDNYFLGHAGQPVDDLIKYTRDLSPLELMEKTLKWCHIAPTAPDTLPCFPFTNGDPFLLKNLPQVYFAGNQKSFSTSLYNDSVRVITVPKFAETGVAVLVNIDSPTFECTPINFNGLDG